MTLIDAIRQALLDAGVTPVYLAGGMPDTKDDGVTVNPYMGEPVDADQTVVGDIQRVQIYVRGKSYQSGYDLAWKAYKALLQAMVGQVVFEGYRILEFLQSPSYIGRDEKQRYLSSFNLRSQKILED